MKPILIALAILSLIALAVAISIIQIRKVPIVSFDQTIVEQYCQHIANERYDDAYHYCLTQSYRDAVSLDEFIAAHKKRRLEFGAMKSRKMIGQQSSSNLFSGEHTHPLHYELYYANHTVREYLVLSDLDGEYRVEGTYTSFGEGLNFKLW